MRLLLLAALLDAAYARFGCSGHGECVAGVCVEGRCVCDEAFAGERCEHRSCEWMAANRPCVNGGVCSNGTCACPYGSGGEFCELSVCEAGRSGHGTCGYAECHPGYTGSLCNELVVAHCPSSCAPIDDVPGRDARGSEKKRKGGRARGEVEEGANNISRA